MNRWILIISVCLLSSCGKTNADYEKDIENTLDDLLLPGVSKERIMEYLETNHYKYSETSLVKCLELKKSWKEAPCKKGPYIHTRIKIKKSLNPVESAAHVYYFFNEANHLEGYDIQVKHTFL